MTDATYFETRATTAARRIAPRLWIFVWVGLLLLVPGILIGDRTASLAFTISSSSVFAVALFAIGLNRRYMASARHFHESLDIFVHNDFSPTLFATDDGEITYANRAAIGRFGQVLHRSLVMLLADYTANPVNVIFRMQNRARDESAAQENIVTPRGHLRLAVHYVGAQGFIWRLEDIVEIRSPSPHAPPPGAMPMLITNRSGKVLHMNRALLSLCGGPVETLDRLFSDLPLVPDGVTNLSAQKGNLSVRVFTHDIQGGRREIYLSPVNSIDLGPGEKARILDTLPVALLKLSPEGVVIRANRQARDLLGPLQPGKTALSDLVQGLGRPIGDWLREISQEKVKSRPEIVQSRGRKQEKYIQISMSTVRNGTETYLNAVLSDATELKTLEAQFVQSQKMQAIGKLAGGVAHDFNNLLTAISGYCDLLLMRHDEGDPDFSDLAQINQNANRAASLVSQLLAFSRKQTLQPENLDLRDTLSDLSHLLNRLLGEKFSLKVATDNDIAAVRADKRQLEQVLMNLVVNARDAMEQGGEVKIETQNLFLETELCRDRAVVPAGKYASIRVIDHGTGIAREQLSKIFEPFFTTKKTGEGTGLGLSMVYGIIKQTGGFIFVDSVFGQGSSFQILLPALDQANVKKIDDPSDRQPVARPVSGGVVLLVEDEAPVRAFASRALKIRGYTVVEACNADEALELLKDPTLAVDVFVTDVVMPGKDGPTWVREALKSNPDIGVVFISGYAEESFSDQQAEIPNSVFLPKPFSLDELTETVCQQISNTRLASPSDRQAIASSRGSTALC